MLRNLKIVSLCAILAMGLTANEVENSTNEEIQIQTQNNMSDASSKEEDIKSVEDFFNDFAREFNIVYADSKDGKVFYNAKSTVTVGANDPDFAKALSTAYAEAFFNIQVNFIRDTFGRQSSQILKTSFTDNSTNAKEFENLPPEGVMAQLFSKLSKLVGAKLDQLLAEFGVDVPKGISTERKKMLLSEKLIKNISTTAIGQISGLVPVQTVVLKDGSVYDVGVIAVMSEKTTQIARDMRYKRNSNVQGKGKNIMEFLPKTNDGFLNEFGLRLVYDETGSPVVLSYGRWGYLKNSADDYINKKQKDIALNTAIAQADAAISEFINLSLSLKESSKSGKQVEHYVTQLISSENVSESEKIAKNIIDITSSEIRANSSVQLKGIKTLKNWSVADKNGIEHVGAVRFYSYNNIKNTDDILKIKDKEKSSTTPTKKAKTETNISNKSRVVNDLNDF